MKLKEKIKVVFRNVKYDDGDREILALFPEERNQFNGLITCYAHIGQHGMADYHCIIKLSKPATEEEYSSLLAELKEIYDDYELVIRKKHQFYRR